jgi:hypothetical protein
MYRGSAHALLVLCRDTYKIERMKYSRKCIVVMQDLHAL